MKSSGFQKTNEKRQKKKEIGKKVNGETQNVIP